MYLSITINKFEYVFLSEVLVYFGYQDGTKIADIINSLQKSMKSFQGGNEFNLFPFECNYSFFLSTGFYQMDACTREIFCPPSEAKHFFTSFF